MDIHKIETAYKLLQDFYDEHEAEVEKMDTEKPYSDEDYEEAKKQGLDLDDWNDYVRFYGLGEEVNYDDM